MTTSSINPSPEVVTKTAVDAEAPPAPAVENALLEHDYDGIREYDNPLPQWWVMLFWATIVFSIAYGVHYHLTPRGKSVIAAYDEDMRLAREERAKQSLAEAPSEAALGKLMADADLMRDAKVTFGERCAVCHGPEGQGLIGPNLTDGHVIHGNNTLMDIYGVVTRGVPNKGMPAWELQLQPIEVRKLIAYVGSLRGKNLPGKPPEGHAVEAR